MNSKLAVFITEDMHKELSNITDPTKKVAWLVAHVTTPATAHEYAVLRIQTRLPVFAAVSEGILTAIDAVCKCAGWHKMLEDEATALSFEKTLAQDIRVTLGGALYVGAMGTGVGNVVKAYGTWRNLYATGMAERIAGEQLAARAGIALRVAGALTAAVSGVVGVMDVVDANESRHRKQWGLMMLQAGSGCGLADHGGRSALVKATPDARNFLLEKGAKIGDQAAIMASWDLNACASEATANRNLSSFALGVVDNMNKELGKSSSETDMALRASLFASRTECKNLTSLKVDGRRLANTAALEHEGTALRFHDIAIICNTGKDGKIECKNANP